MALFLSEKDVASVVTMADAIEAVREVFRWSGEGKVLNPPRQHVSLPGGFLRLTAAAVPPMERMAVKVSSTLVFKSNSGRLLILSEMQSGRILALVEVFNLGSLRTGAASGVATDILARADARSVGIFGSGRQARTQLLAVASVRPIERVTALSPNRDYLDAFCKEMGERLRITVAPAGSAEELYQSDIVITATTSKRPVLFGRLLRPGTHINAIGGNMLDRSELDEEAVGRSDLIAVDNKEQAEQECGELVRAVESGAISWDRVKEIGEIAAGKSPGRQGRESITLYKSLGVAMEDVALAARAYERARERGVGIEVPLTEN